MRTFDTLYRLDGSSGVPVPVVVGAGLPLPEEAGEVFDVAGAPPETLGVPTWGVAVATAPTPPVLGPLSWIYGTLSEIYHMLPSGASLQSSRWSQSQLQPT